MAEQETIVRDEIIVGAFTDTLIRLEIVKNNFEGTPPYHTCRIQFIPRVDGGMDSTISIHTLGKLDLKVLATLFERAASKMESDINVSRIK
jgi:hypothetical protein